MNTHKLTFFFLLCLSLGSLSCKNNTDKNKAQPKGVVFQSPLGKAFTLPEPNPKMVLKYKEAKEKFEADPNNADNIIWYGRRTAYLGRYEDAINIYTKGIEQFPKDPRFLRHRGHRYISLRRFDKAIADLEQAAQLIEGTENQIEPDGLPNAKNIPVSSLHGNIWYHLGLAHYLKHNYQKAYDAYLKCRASGNNADNMVSSTHWLYMIQRRLKNDSLALSTLDPITANAEVIENFGYHNLCKFYKGLIPKDSLGVTNTSTPASDAVKYGLANWYFYNNDRENAKKLLLEILEGSSWSSFGYIAAESDILHYFDN